MKKAMSAATSFLPSCVLGVALLAGGVAEADQQQQQDPSRNLLEVAQADGRFSTLLDAVEKAGLDEPLQGDETYTLFAPTNEAFGTLQPGQLDEWMSDDKASHRRLVEVVSYHMVEGEVSLEGSSEVTTLQGTDMAIDAQEGSASVGNAAVVESDIKASNGVIHVVDSVLIPE